MNRSFKAYGCFRQFVGNMGFAFLVCIAMHLPMPAQTPGIAERNQKQTDITSLLKTPYIEAHSAFSDIFYTIEPNGKLRITTDTQASAGGDFVAIKIHQNRNQKSGTDYFLVVISQFDSSNLDSKDRNKEQFPPVIGGRREAIVEINKFNRANDRVFHLDGKGAHEIPLKE